MAGVQQILFTNVAQTHGVIYDHRVPPRGPFSVVSRTSVDFITNIINNPTQFMDHIQACFSHIRIFRTRTHVKLFQRLACLASDLVNDMYVGQQGTSSRVLVGARGMGTTFIMKAFTLAMPLLLPRLIVIHVSIESLTSSLAEVVEKEVDRHLGGTKHNANIPSRARIVEKLERVNVSLVLFVDEFQHLYTMTGTEHNVAMETLKDLRDLGGQSSGRVSVLLAGSSSFITKFVCMELNAHEPLFEEFSLIRTGACSLNDTKYRQLGVYSTLPTDLEAAASITNVPLLPTNVPWLRSIAFLSGCNARDVQAAQHASRTGQTSYEPDPPMQVLAVEIRNIIYKKLAKTNKKICNGLFQGADDATLVANIQQAEWEKHFRPVPFAEIQAAVQRRVAQKKITADDARRFDDMVRHLADRGWIVIDDTATGRVIYPSSLMSLMRHVRHLQGLTTGTITERLLEDIARAPGRLGGIAADPRVIAGVASVASAATCTTV